MNLLKLKKQNLLGYVLVAQLFLYFFYLKTSNYIFLGLYFSTFIPLVIFIATQRFKRSSFFAFFLIVLVFVIFSINSNQYPALISIYNFLYGIIAFFSAYALFKIDTPTKYIKLVFWPYLIFLIYLFATLGFSDPGLYNEVLANSSRNYLSAILILIMVLLALSFEKEKKNIPLIYPFLTFFCCVGLVGRSGIALSALFLLFCLFKQKNFKLMIASITTIAVIIALNFSTIEYFISEKTNFINGLNSERSIFLHEYLHNITYNYSELFFGRRLQNCCQFIILFENTHNSFIMGHLRYGIAHTIFSIGIFIYILLSRNITFILFGLIILSRFSVDQLGLFTPFDIVLYYLLFIIYQSKRKNNRLNVPHY
ncbi:hypothetical protein [Acinetobacter baumannii]|uniref:hypothetical protein n=1 Tax=Acinetobacter baumannii TaxID=470 RepID=UPI002340BB55|nr:hypothetical protein [Acinetobacter baumannii]MDC4051993.1 hypothetical protein [Acinetobacter baumannii]MDC4139876.1 hypothetical protein [Acinetobacter baumannii]